LAVVWFLFVFLSESCTVGYNVLDELGAPASLERLHVVLVLLVRKEALLLERSKPKDSMTFCIRVWHLTTKLSTHVACAFSTGKQHAQSVQFTVTKDQKKWVVSKSAS
jgi:hypothetical protein